MCCPTELREDDEAIAKAQALEFALTAMERAITRWETATEQINQAFKLMDEAAGHLLYMLEHDALGPAAREKVKQLVGLMHNKILCHHRAVDAATAKQLYALKPVARFNKP